MAQPPLTFDELFDPAFLESLKNLHILARRVARGGLHAEQRSRDMGGGIEFRDYRPYTPGDDFRAIDWNIYRRLGKVFLRLFEQIEDLPLYLLTDISKSLFLESPPRIRASLRCALALASISLGQHDRVGLFSFSSDLKIAVRPLTGRGHLLQFAKAMVAFQPEGLTDFRMSLKRFSALGLRRGLLVVLSDFFDPAGIEAVVKALKEVRHKLLLVQLWRPSDNDPELSGDVELMDCESGEALEVSLTPNMKEHYRQARQRFANELNTFAESRQTGILRLNADADVLPQLATLFEGGSLVP